MNKIAKKIISLFIASLLVSCNLSKTTRNEDFTQYVNTFIGTDGTGHTFLGPCRPFGMVQPGSDNNDEGWGYTSGYQYHDSTILGFSQTRASGTGINEFGDILLLPYSGEKENMESKKTNEQAEIGYYKIELNDNVIVELTSTERVSFHKYTFPTEEANVFLNFQHGLRFFTDSLVLNSDVKIENKNTISGFCHTKNWVERKYFFTIQFDNDFSNIGQLPKEEKDKAPKYCIKFNLNGKVLKVKIALSTVDVVGAKRNLKSELDHWDFKLVRKETKEEWNKYLSRIEIDAPKDQMETFYTALYHLLIHPSNIADVDGRYRGPNDVIYTSSSGRYYSTLSLWDTFRAAHPLYTILVPERVNEFVQTMLDHFDAQGYLPIWTAWGQENYCMIGNHSIPVIVDAYMKGFQGFNPNRALDAMTTSTTENHHNSYWDMYNKYGYYPFDLIDNEAVSRTLESGVDDYAIALMAEKMGKNETAEEYYKRSRYYENLFDPETKLLRGKDTEENFRKPFDPLTPTSPLNNPGDYTEANAWQYLWVPAHYDIGRFIELLGGKKEFTNKLDEFFSIETESNKHLGQEAMIGQYAHGNEPSHHIAYLYTFSEKPERSRELISQIYNQFYNNAPDGITGNEDCGQMSAWYIFSTLGFYPVNPVNGKFTIGIPQVDRAVVKLGNERKFLIKKKSNNIHEIYINDKLITDYQLEYSAIMNGGILVFK